MRYEKHALCAIMIVLSSARLLGDIDVMASEEYVDNSVYAARTNLEEQIGIAYSSSTNYADVVKTNLEEKIGIVYSNSTAYADTVLTNAYKYTYNSITNVESRIDGVYQSAVDYTDGVKDEIDGDIYVAASSATNYTYSVKTNLEDQINHISPPSVQTNSIAMFVLQVQNEDSIDFSGFELKCSTNNFNGVEFWSHSSYPEDPSTDGMRMFITGTDLDRRKLSEISSYDMYSYHAQKLVVVLVSVDECRRTDGKWLHEGNDDLMWIWIRATEDGREVAPGYDDELWRPVAPVKWLSRLPSWAR